MGNDTLAEDGVTGEKSRGVLLEPMVRDVTLSNNILILNLNSQVTLLVKRTKHLIKRKKMRCSLS